MPGGLAWTLSAGSGWPVVTRLLADAISVLLTRLFTLQRVEQMRKANITHVLSVLRYNRESPLFQPYKHFLVDVDDVEDEDLLQHFAATNAFIQEGLDGGGGVFVHW